MKHIHGTELFESLLGNNRIYLCGNLKKPQDLQWIHDDNIEVGISYYQEFTADLPHQHSIVSEYNFVVSGSCKVLVVSEQKEYIFEEGSLFIIPPQTKYASKHRSNTKILFFKVPGGNDKELIEVSPSIQEWLSKW